MAYVDYEFYISKYYGNVIQEEDFPRLSDKASNKIDKLTFGRVEVFFDELDRQSAILTEPDKEMLKLEAKIKKSVCALAEKMLDVESANDIIRQNGGGAISSVSSGSESISYNKDYASITEAEQDKLYYAIARDYLSGTGLLYAGI